MLICGYNAARLVGDGKKITIPLGALGIHPTKCTINTCFSLEVAKNWLDNVRFHQCTITHTASRNGIDASGRVLISPDLGNLTVARRLHIYTMIAYIGLKHVFNGFIWRRLGVSSHLSVENEIYRIEKFWKRVLGLKKKKPLQFD